MRTHLERKLSPAQREDFYQRCRAAKGGFTGPVILAIAADFGIKLQHDSANNVRKMLVARYEAELREHADTARAIAVAAQHGLGLNDAAAVKLALKVNDALDRPEELTLKEKGQYSLLISRLRAGDQRGQMVQMLREKLRLQQFDAVAAAIKHAKQIRAVIDNPKLDQGKKTERVRKILFGEMPADWQPVTATGASAEEGT
ncbi:MAG: hypothetical protein V4773_25815 [Verrucomicrobiota bacterium]